MELPIGHSSIKIQAHKSLHWLAIPSLAVVLVLWPIVYSNLDLLLIDAGVPLLNLY